jgi:hypothetical protein
VIWSPIWPPGRLVIISFFFWILQHNARFNSFTCLQSHLSSSHHLDISREKSMAMLPHPPSSDKHLALLASLPLFMSSLPGDPVDNIALRVQQSLAQDGTPDGRTRYVYIVQAALTGVWNDNKGSRRTSKSRAMSISGASGVRKH